MKRTMSKALIVYYSRRGENYVGGVIKKLQQGEWLKQNGI